MTTILADEHLDGHVVLLRRLLEADEWRDLSTALSISVLQFGESGLDRGAPDADVWRRCQERGWILWTANRNSDGPDSLEITIRAENHPAALPVFTVGNLDRFVNDREYAARFVERMLERLLDLHAHLGTGRIFLP